MIEQESKKQYSKYRTQSGDTLANILRRLNLKPLWGDSGYVEKSLQLNTANKYLENLNALKADVEIILPITDQDVNYQYDDEGYLILPKAEEQKRKVASPEPLKKEKVKKLDIKYSCKQDTNPEVYTLLSQFIGKSSNFIEDVSVDFSCNDLSNHEESKESTYKLIDLAPWVPSADPEISKIKIKKKNFLFLSLGKSDVTYKEGPTFETEFTNYYLSAQYRHLLDRTKWYLDMSAEYSVSDTEATIVDSEPRILDIDLRLGRVLKNLREPWSLSLYAGVYYTQMFVENDSYGYKGTYYPQLYPEVRRLLRNGDVLTFNLKYVPTGNDFFDLDGDNRALEWGATYLYRGFSLPLNFHLRYSDFQFNSESTNTDVRIERLNFSIGTGF